MSENFPRRYFTPLEVAKPAEKSEMYSTPSCACSSLPEDPSYRSRQGTAGAVLVHVPEYRNRRTVSRLPAFRAFVRMAGCRGTRPGYRTRTRRSICTVVRVQRSRDRYDARDARPRARDGRGGAMIPDATLARRHSDVSDTVTDVAASIPVRRVVATGSVRAFRWRYCLAPWRDGYGTF